MALKAWIKVLILLIAVWQIQIQDRKLDFFISNCNHKLRIIMKRITCKVVGLEIGIVVTESSIELATISFSYH